MYIWPNGEVTGSVHHATLDAFHRALAAGEPLDDWAANMPPGLTAADYADYPVPDLRTDTEREADEQAAAARAEAEPAEPPKRGPGRPRKTDTEVTGGDDDVST